MNTNNTISEETIASIVDAAQNIAADSTAMRQNLVDVADALSPIFQVAGIEFQATDHDDSWLAIRKHYDGMGLVIVAMSNTTSFANASRVSLGDAIEKLPTFLLAYSEELEQRRIHFADLREKTAAMKAIVAG